MYNILFIFGIFFYNIINAYDLSLSKPMSKNEVLKITNLYDHSFFCKNDICVATINDYSKPTIEIPDKNGNYINYIIHTCTYEHIKLDEGFTKKHCETDEQCLSNKCFNTICMYNNETLIVHCDNIYTSPTLFRSRSSYMYCGKAYGDNCKTNDECSSKKCIEGYCGKQTNGPSDSESFGPVITLCFIIFIFIFIIGICCCCFLYYKNKKYKKYKRDIPIN